MAERLIRAVKGAVVDIHETRSTVTLADVRELLVTARSRVVTREKSYT